MPVPGIEIRPRGRAPGASRSTRESLRRGSCARRSEPRCDGPASRRVPPNAASCGTPGRRAQAAEQQFAPLDLCFVAIQPARRRSGENLAIPGEQRVVAGADEFVLALLPMVGAPPVGTLRAERGHALVGILPHPGRTLLANDLPPIDAVAAEHHLHRLIRRKTGHVAGLDPFALFPGLWRKKEVYERGHADRKSVV